MTHRAFCGALVEETGRVLAVPAPPSPRPPDLEEVEENVDKDKEKEEENVDKHKEKEDEGGKGGEDENETSAVAEVDEPQHVEAAMEEPQPQRIPSPPSPTPPSPTPQEQQPMVAVVPNLDGMLLLHFAMCLSYYLFIDYVRFIAKSFSLNPSLFVITVTRKGIHESCFFPNLASLMII